MEKNEIKNIKLEYVSNIKALAIIMVLILHSYSALCYKFPDLSMLEFGNAILWDSFVRPAVPLFLIISGATLLARDYNIINWYKEKIFMRLSLPYLFYGTIYIFILHKPLSSYLSPSTICYHFYFFSTILALYILYPILRIIIINANKSVVIYTSLLFISLPIINFLFPTFSLFDIHIFNFDIIYPFIGYYLSRIELSKYKNTALGIYLLSTFIVWGGTYFLSQKYGQLNDILFHYLSPVVILGSFSLFIFLKHSDIKLTNILKNIRDFLARHTYGIFFIHPLIMGKLYYLYNKVNLIHGLIIFLYTLLICCLIFYISEKILQYLKDIANEKKKTIKFIELITKTIA